MSNWSMTRKTCTNTNTFTIIQRTSSVLDFE